MERTAARTDAEMANRVRVRTMRERRFRIMKSLGIFVVVMSAMFLLALANRDSAAIREAQRETASFVEVLETAFQELGRPPHPASDPELRKLGPRFAFDPLSFYGTKPRANGDVTVCCRKTPVKLFLRDDRRLLIAYDGKSFQMREMPEPQFREQAQRLGFAFLLSR